MSEVNKSKVPSIEEILAEHRKIYENLVPFSSEKQTLSEYQKAREEYAVQKYNEERDLWQDKGPAQIA